jgi:hypothetical protein
MAKLTTKKRKALPASDFAGPGRSYPVNNPNHAANAKARATQMVEKGKLSPAEKKKIDAKADKVIGKSKGKPASGKSKPKNDTSKPDGVRGKKKPPRMAWPSNMPPMKGK